MSRNPTSIERGTVWFKACGKCGGDIFLDSDEHDYFLHCINCGKEPNKYEQKFLIKEAKRARY